MNQFKWRISWRFKATGFSGHGSSIFYSYTHAVETVRWANRECPWIEHWAECVVFDHT